MAKQVEEKNFMVSQVESSIKSEVNKGISQIIGDIFRTIFAPILKGIDFIKSRVAKSYEIKQARNCMSFILGSNLLHQFCKENSTDMVIFTIKSIKKDESKESIDFTKYKDVKVIYNNIQHMNSNVESMCKYPTPLNMMTKWFNRCIDDVIVERENYTDKMRLYFGNYGRLHFFRYRLKFIICMTAASVDITEQQKQKIYNFIEYLK